MFICSSLHYKETIHWFFIFFAAFGNRDILRHLNNSNNNGNSFLVSSIPVTLIYKQFSFSDHFQLQPLYYLHVCTSFQPFSPFIICPLLQAIAIKYTNIHHKILAVLERYFCTLRFLGNKMKTDKCTNNYYTLKATSSSNLGARLSGYIESLGGYLHQVYKSKNFERCAFRQTIHSISDILFCANGIWCKMFNWILCANRVTIICK